MENTDKLKEMIINSREFIDKEYKTLNPTPPHVVVISNRNSFIQRLWILISNPFLYLFAGKIRY